MTTHPSYSLTLAHLAAEVRRVNTANGWFDDDRSRDEDAVLLHSEVSEALEAYRDAGLRDTTPALEFDRSGGSMYPATRPAKPEGWGSELADILIRLLDTCDRQDLGPVWWHKALADVEVSLVDDDSVTSLLARLHRRIAMGQFGLMLYDLKLLAEVTGTDLLAEYVRKIAYNATRGHKHGGKRL